MSRQVPPDRFAALIEAGTAMFVAHGYRRTQMQDVAEAMGVAKTTSRQDTRPDGAHTQQPSALAA